jgi:hypothetical protein
VFSVLRKKKKVAAGKAELNLPNVDFKPKSPDKQTQQGILIACRGIEQYASTVTLIAQALVSRADQVLMDYSQQGGRRSIPSRWSVGDDAPHGPPDGRRSPGRS